MKQNWLGLDIGGANIKFADLHGEQGNEPFELWKQPELLAGKLATAVPDWDSYDCLAVTMTGELADCFESKQQGVQQICDAVCNASNASQISFYQTTGQFVNAGRAVREWSLTAASNWHAVASFTGSLVSECIVIDIGTTTTDIIAVAKGEPAAIGNTDLQRIQNSELLYTGVVRSPVCAVTQTAKLNGRILRISQEFFATMLDVYIVINRIPESDNARHTADGRPANRHCALRRLAKMFCADLSEISEADLVDFAKQAAASQASSIRAAVETVSLRFSQPVPVVLLGEGKWLGKQIVSSLSFYDETLFSEDLRSFADCDLIADFDTASAVAWLARNRIEAPCEKKSY